MGGRDCWAEELSGQKFSGGLDSRTQEPYPGLGRPLPLLARLTQAPVYPLPPGTFGYSLSRPECLVLGLYLLQGCL